jgi:hypothetical protein
VLKPHLVWKVARTVVKLFFFTAVTKYHYGDTKHSYVLDSIHVLGMMKVTKKKWGSSVPVEGAVRSVT